MDLSPDWNFVADTVMGGASQGAVTSAQICGRAATRLTGTVSLENNCGFIQMASDLGQGDAVLDAQAWSGLELDVTGNGETYDLRLRTDQLARPWQSFRTGFVAGPGWHSLRFPFSAFAPNKTDMHFDPGRLCRVGVLAVGREFEADIAVAGLRLYRERAGQEAART